MLGYLKSFYTKLAFIMGLVMYVSYALPTDNWQNTYLIFVSIFVAVFLPFFTKISEKLERFVVLRTGSMFLGKVIRFLWQYAFNYFALTMVITGGIVDTVNLQFVGGLYGAIALTSFASQGLQYVMLALANKNIGDRYLNITLALSFNVCISAIASLGYVPVQLFFVVTGILLGIIGALYSLVTDLKGIFSKKSGVGVFFGTFNPAHVSHMKIIEKFIQERNLEKVYVHPTIVPKLHQALLDEGIIRIAKMKDGMRIYEKTEKADFHIDYFPTGNIFFEAENRIAMLRSAVSDANLENKVEVLAMPDLYIDKGFHGIIKHIKNKHEGKRIYDLHGSDYGGMLVRTIYDEMFLTPYTIVRKDNISATAIRNGAEGMTSKTVTEILNILKDDSNANDGDIFEFSGIRYIYSDSKLIELD